MKGNKGQTALIVALLIVTVIPLVILAFQEIQGVMRKGTISARQTSLGHDSNSIAVLLGNYLLTTKVVTGYNVPILGTTYFMGNPERWCGGSKIPCAAIPTVINGFTWTSWSFSKGFPQDYALTKPGSPVATISSTLCDMNVIPDDLILNMMKAPSPHLPACPNQFTATAFIKSAVSGVNGVAMFEAKTDILMNPDN